MKRMLFNATQQEELRVAIVDGQKLIDIDIETAGREQRKSNIYKGVITRIEPSLEACFVNYGEERHGFLPFKEVARSYFRDGVDVRNASIREALREGQEIMVQVEKEERGNKGAALTSFISLAGRYLVLMPNNPRGGGVSRRVEGEDRQELRETMDKLDLPQGMSVIARTAGIGRTVEELQWDLNYLMQLWTAIEGASKAAPGAFLIYQESSLVIRAIRDYFQPDIGEILIDTDDIYEQAQQFMSHVMPDMVHRVKRYRDDVPLFSRFQIEHQIETAYSRTVPLPSGGAIVIDHTEALVSIDVNSARATRGSDIETTAFNTNLEAADEVARQLRLRDLGGLIVIDFIDMENAKNQREIENRLKDALHYDRARVQMGKISRFGLMELSRQRLRPSLSEGSHVTCPRCNGTGHIRDTESSALQVLRIIQEEAMKENSAAIHVQSPVDVAAFLLNEKRGEILKIETRHRVSVILIPNKHLETPHYKLERIKHDDPRLDDMQASYKMAEEVDTDIGYSKRNAEEAKPRQEAVVKSITPDQPAPVVERKSVEPAPVETVVVEGFLSRLFGLFRKKAVAPAAPEVAAKPGTRERTERSDRGERGGRNRRGRGRGRDKDERDATADAKPVKEVAVAKEVRETREPKEVREPRQPRQAREPKESREPREAREPKEIREPREAREAREAREPREVNEPRQPKPPREERKPVDEVALPAQAELPKLPTEVMPSAAVDGADELTSGVEAIVNENGEEQPRRRRRRGGRNRNRRDRDQVNGENGEHGDNGESLAADDEAVDELSSDTIASAPVEVAAAAVEMPVIEETPVAPIATAEAVQAVTEHVSVPTPAAVEAPQPTQPVQAVQEPAQSTEAAEAVVPTVVAATEVRVEPASEAATGLANDATTVASQVAAPQPAPKTEVTAAPIAVTAAAATAPAVHADIEEMLRAAGLQMTVTNPERLQTVQAQQAAVMPAPRPRRERKAMPPASAEPLVQVETRH